MKNSPVEHAKSLVRACRFLYNDIHRIGENRPWSIEDVNASPLDIVGIIHVNLRADSDEQFTWADIKQIEDVIRKYDYPIECVVFTAPAGGYDCGYDYDFDFDDYEEVLTQNEPFRRQFNGQSTRVCFEHPNRRCPVNDTELRYDGRFHLYGVSLRDIEQYADDPIAMEIMRTVCDETGCAMENLPEITPITSKEIKRHVREIQKTILAGKEITTINIEIGVRLSGTGSSNKKFYVRAISSTNDRTYDYNNELQDSLRHMWSVTFPYVLKCEPAAAMYLHTNDTITSKRLTQLHETYFAGFDVVDVRFTTKPIAHEFIEHQSGKGAEIILVDEGGRVIAVGHTDGHEDEFADCVTRFLQDFGSCAGN